MTLDPKTNLSQALWKIYRRSERPLPWSKGGTLPWNDPEFSERMLREHLDQSHGAASRTEAELTAQLDWLWHKLALQPGSAVYDMTCGPGLYATPLAQRGCRVTGVGFSAVSIYKAWDGLPVYDAEEWVIYVAEKNGNQ